MINLGDLLFGVFILVAVVIMGVLAYQNDNLEKHLQAARDSIQVDTVYAPQPPGWIEAFRLECQWIPETNDGGAE